MNKIRKKAIESCEISEIAEVTLNGFPQKIMIEGKSKANPIVICLHGGPGSPIPFSVGCRGIFPEITEKFILVCWDQLGCGINNRPIDDSFNIDTFVRMTVDLIKEIKKRFPDNKLYLFGMSWGSILSASASEQASPLLDGVIAYGQVIHQLTFNEEVFAALENSDMPNFKKKKFQKAKSLNNVQNAKLIMSYIRKHTDGYTCKAVKQGKNKAADNIVWQLLTSPDYKLKDFLAIVINGYLKNTSLLTELFNIDLRNTLSSIKVPYKIIQGETDIVTSTKTAEIFISQSKNTNLELITIPNNGHIPDLSAMKTIIEELGKMI